MSSSWDTKMTALSLSKVNNTSLVAHHTWPLPIQVALAQVVMISSITLLIWIAPDLRRTSLVDGGRSMRFFASGLGTKGDNEERERSKNIEDQRLLPPPSHLPQFKESISQLSRLYTHLKQRCDFAHLLACLVEALILLLSTLIIINSQSLSEWKSVTFIPPNSFPLW